MKRFKKFKNKKLNASEIKGIEGGHHANCHTQRQKWCYSTIRCALTWSGRGMYWREEIPRWNGNGCTTTYEFIGCSGC